MKNTILAILALALTLSLVYISITSNDEDPKVKELEDKIETLQEKARNDSLRIEEADAAAAEIASQKDSLLNELESKGEARESRTDSVVAGIEDVEVRAAVAVAVAAEREQHQSAVRRLVSYFESRDAARLRQIGARDSLITTQRSIISAKDEVIEELKQKLRPTIDLGFISFDLGCQPGGQINVNPQGRVDIGVGVNCGIPL